MGEEVTNVRTTVPFQVAPAAPAGGKAYLIVLSGGTIGQTYEISRRTIVGRKMGVDLRLPDDMLSREHAVLFPTHDDEFVIQDLHSSNGTWVNGERVTEHVLRNGDRIQIGRTVWKFALQDDLESKLRDAQRMEAVGALAAGIAHDFNNLLGVVTGGVSYLEDVLAEAGIELVEARQMLRDMGVAAARAAELTGQLLGFARHGEIEQKPIDVSSALEESVKLAGRTFDPRVRIETRIERDLRVTGDRSQIQQMLLNLCINARDAMPDGGTLRVVVDRASIETEEAAVRGLVSAGMYVRIEVSDTGVGMDELTRQRVFEPFASTKGIGRGLGLATVYGIVRGHAGAIEVHSALGRGTTFTIHLPALTMDDGTVQVVRESNSVPIATDTGVVLLVDDDFAVRTVGARLLQRLGYEVIQARDGREAVSSYYLRQDEIKFVLLDLLMPDMNGAETFDQLRGMNSEVKVLLCSGYDDGQARDVLDRGAVAFLPKPYSLKALRAAIGDLLDEGA